MISSIHLLEIAMEAAEALEEEHRTRVGLNTQFKRQQKVQQITEVIPVGAGVNIYYDA